MVQQQGLLLPSQHGVSHQQQQHQPQQSLYGRRFRCHHLQLLHLSSTSSSNSSVLRLLRSHHNSSRSGQLSRQFQQHQ